jgi:hypothetical protein
MQNPHHSSQVYVPRANNQSCLDGNIASTAVHRWQEYVQSVVLLILRLKVRSSVLNAVSHWKSSDGLYYPNRWVKYPFSCRLVSVIFGERSMAAAKGCHADMGTHRIIRT